MSELKDQPLVSVLVPCYNVERYLRQCLDSLAAQTLENLEFICINDGSTDSTPDIIAQYAAQDGRFRQIDKPNSGYGASMNRGLDAARGRYIGILESDDFCDVRMFERMVDAAELAEADAVKANFYFYWSKPAPREQLFNLNKPQTPKMVNPMDYHELFWYMPSIWSGLYRRDFLENNAIRFLETPGASYQDLSFTFKTWACAKKVVLLEEGFVRYRQDNEGSSIHSPGKVYCVCDEFAEIERFLDAHPEKATLWPVETRLKYDSYIWNYRRLDEDLRTLFLGRFHDDFRIAQRMERIDYKLFQPWSEANLRHILADPGSFDEWARTGGSQQGGLRALIRYLRLGGFGLATKRFLYKEE